MTTSEQVLEMIQYWTTQKDSKQKDVVLAYWLKQASKFTKVTLNGRTVTTKEKREAFKALALFYKVPAKLKGETVSKQAHRLTTGKGYTMTVEDVLRMSY